MLVAAPRGTVVPNRTPARLLPWVAAPKSLPRVIVAPYFQLDTGETFTPMGQNDAITWPEFAGLFRRKDTATAKKYVRMLADHGVTVLRLMLEYSQFDKSCFEKPAGKPQKAMIQLWDDIFSLCEENGLRVLLTPYDTFWLWI